MKRAGMTISAQRPSRSKIVVGKDITQTNIFTGDVQQLTQQTVQEKNPDTPAFTSPYESDAELKSKLQLYYEKIETVYAKIAKQGFIARRGVDNETLL